MIPCPDIHLRRYDGEVQRHRHAFHQFVLPRRGRLDLDLAVGARRAAGDVGVLIPAGEDHAFRGVGPNEFLVVDVPADTSPRLFDRARREPELHVRAAAAHHLAFAVERARRGSLSAAFRHHWTALLIEALDDGSGASGAARFDAAAAFIRRHCDRPLSVAEVARAVHLGEAGLYDLFRRHTGAGPRAWIARARAEYAARLLRTSACPVAEIAQACGFSEPSALTRAFRRHFGTTPTDWRRRA